MQITVVNETDNTTRYKLTDVNTTVIEAIIDGLNNNSDVVYARYIIDHPDLTEPMLEIKFSKGTAKKALQKACEDFQKYFSSIEE